MVYNIKYEKKRKEYLKKNKKTRILNLNNSETCQI